MISEGRLKTGVMAAENLALLSQELKGYFTQKWSFIKEIGHLTIKSHHLLILRLFQTCMHVFLLLNTEDILKDMGDKTPLVSIFCFYTMEVNGGPQWFSYKHSSKYLILCSTEKKKFIKVWNNLTMSKW